MCVANWLMTRSCVIIARWRSKAHLNLRSIAGVLNSNLKAIQARSSQMSGGLVKHLKISKELMREFVAVPGGCCSQLHTRTWQTYIASCKRGVHVHPPYPPKSATAQLKVFQLLIAWYFSMVISQLHNLNEEHSRGSFSMWNMWMWRKTF